MSVLVHFATGSRQQRVGWAEPTGRANARPMINSAIPINCYSWVDGFRKGLNPSYELPAFFRGSEKFGSIEKAVRTVEYRDERRAVGSMRDMDVAAGSPYEVTRSTAPLRVFQRPFEHESLFECGVLVQWHDRAGRHLEQDGRAPFVVLVQDLHLYAIEVGSLPVHRRCRNNGR